MCNLLYGLYVHLLKFEKKNSSCMSGWVGGDKLYMTGSSQVVMKLFHHEKHANQIVEYLGPDKKRCERKNRLKRGMIKHQDW